MPNQTIDSYANTEEILARRKQEMLDYFNEQLGNFITTINTQMFLTLTFLFNRIIIKDYLWAKFAVADCLKPTVEEISGLPNFQKAVQVCKKTAECKLVISPREMPLKNEGLTYYNFDINVNRPTN